MPTAVAQERAVIAATPPVRAGLRVTYPLEGTIFPPDIAAPTFVWEDASHAGRDPRLPRPPGNTNSLPSPSEREARTGAKIQRFNVVVRDAAGVELDRASVQEARWRPSAASWARIKERSVSADAVVTVAASGEITDVPAADAASVRFRTAREPVGDAIFYREVPLPFLEAVQDPSRIRWRFGTIDSEAQPPIVLENLPVCGNCHSFADNGSVLGLDVDYGNDKGAYGIVPVAPKMVLDDDKIITWADYARDNNELTFGLLSRVSPTGRYVISTVKDRSVFIAIPEIEFSQLFFPIKGILVVYDRETKQFAALPGADDPAYVQTNAAWSPDGKEIVFARAKAHFAERLEQINSAIVDEKDVPEFTVDGKRFRYDLYRIPFNGGKGGKAEPLAGASGNGRSNFFPKYSPDGKWIVFTQADSFMLLQPDSELYIVPTGGGKARRLRHNTARMNSWHSWSSNSRWLVFSSKVNTPYTQLFVTHIDADGNDSPPVLLERFTSPDRAANIPEFVRLPGDAIQEISEKFLDPYSFLRAGMANQRTGDHAGAIRLFRRGMEIAPKEPELHNALGWSLFQEGRSEEAVAAYERALAVDPKHVKSHNNLALALVDLGRLEDAARHFEASLAIEPKAEIYSDLGFTLARLGKDAEAQKVFARALAIDPDCPSAHFNMAVVAVQGGDFRTAEAHYRRALPARPTPETYNGLGFVLARQGRTDEAIAEYQRAIAADANFVPAYNNLGQALTQQGRLAEAEKVYRESLQRKPNPAIAGALVTVLRRQNKVDEAERIERAMGKGAPH